MNTTPATDVTYVEALEALTGHDEKAINERLGVDLYAEDLSTKERMAYRRAVMFGHLRHQGVSDDDAYEQVMSFTQAQVLGYFTPSTDVDEDEPEADTPSGKGESQPDEPPTS